MLYSEYSKRMSKVAAFFNVLRRFKILILCIFGAILAVTATLIGTHGLVFDSAACPTEVEYGGEFTYRAGAFLDGVEYEFCAVGSDVWTSEKPIRTGRYYVRAVSTRTFGAKSYGKVHEFSIVPKPTKIEIASSVVFGEKPEYSAELVYGDSFTVGGFTYADVSKPSTLVKADLSSITVADENGEDVTSSYSFISEYGDIAFIPREIEITVADANGVYDGQPLTSSAWELTGGTLADGDGIVTVFEKSQTEVGSTENTPKISVSRAVLNNDGIDVSANYKIVSKVGKLTVEKREIIVDTADGSHIYDDTAYRNPEFSVEDGYSLVGDDRLVAAVAQSITDVGSTQNKILFEVHDANGEDVTYNYSVVIVPGTLTVEKREVEIVSADAAKVYDGTPLVNAGYRIDGTLAAGHTFKVTSDTEITSAGSVPNALEGVVYGVDGTTDKTDNYTIVWSYGALTVLKRDVTVKTADAEWVYDGLSHSSSAFTVLPSDDENYGLIDGHVAVNGAPATVTDVVRGEDGGILGVDNVMAFAVTYGGEDVTDNYEIKVEYGTLVVKPRELIVLSATHFWMYDDEVHSDDGFTITSGTVADGQTAVVTGVTEVKYVASVENVLGIGVTELRDGVQTDVTSNYDIDCEYYGMLIVTKRPITLSPYARTKVYDGEEYDKDDLSVLYGGFVEDDVVVGGQIEWHVLEHEFYDFTAIDAGTYEDIQIDIDSVVIYDSGDKATANVVTENYEITCPSGSLEIFPRPLYIETESAEWEYDGKAYSHSGFEFVESPTGWVFTPVKDHEIKVTYAPEFTDVRRGDSAAVLSYDNELELAVVGTKESNYKLYVTPGKIKVNPRKITVTTATDSWVFDDKFHYDDSIEVTSGSLVDKHEAYSTDVTYVKYVKLERSDDDGENDNVASVENRLRVRIDEIGLSGSRDVTDNYDITFVNGSLTITKRTLHITTGTEDFVYDGEKHYYPYSTHESDPIVSDSIYPDSSKPYWLNGRSVTAVQDVLRSESGEVIDTPNVMEFTVMDNACREGYPEDGCECYNDNFAFDIKYGKLKVLPRPITVSALDKTVVFNGMVQYPDFEVTNLVEKHKGEASFDTDGKYVGEHSVKIIELKVLEGATDKTGNYDITISSVPATLTITKRPITVVSNGTEDDYRYCTTDYWYYDGTEKIYALCGYKVQIDPVHGIVYDDTGLCIYNRVVLHEIVGENYATITNVGSTQNTFTAKIFECVDPLNGDFSLGDDITENYDVTYEYGTIFVMPRPITLKAGSAEKFYDGTPLICHEYSDIVDTANISTDPLKYVPASLGVASGHTLSLSFTPDSTVTEVDGYMVGSALNTIDYDSIEITDALGDDVTDNYDITLEYGSLIIHKRHVLLTTSYSEKVYDGTPIYASGELLEIVKGYEEVSGLVEGHTPIFGERESITCVPENTEARVELDRIVDANGNDVTKNYNVIKNYGLLTILPRPITVTTNSNTWEYDGEVKHEFGYEITEGSLVEGQKHRWVVYYPFLRDVCEKENKIDIAILDGKWISDDLVDDWQVYLYDEHWHKYNDNYDITYIFGTVSITPRKLTIETATDEWEYDGVVHFNDTYTILSGSIVENQRVETEIWTTIGTPGTVDNFIGFTVFGVEYDREDVTGNYEITWILGTLTVTGEVPDEPDPPDPPGPPGPPAPGEEIKIIRVKSEKSGTLYLRTYGYGVYDGTTEWTASPEYTGQSINYNGQKYSVNYLTSIALKNAGYKAFETEIEILHPQFLTALPYYTTLESGLAYDGDIGFAGDDKYSVMQYMYDYVEDNGAALSSAGLGIYSALEKAYREYVYNTYLDVPSSTADYMRGIISARKFNRNDVAVVSKVAKYIQSAAQYDLYYDGALDVSGDVAVEFLRTYKQGVCRHYATSATMLFRTLGIPARYTVGAICSAEAGEWVDVMSGKAHAWVEVYIDGAGWVNVEVTGGGFDPDGDGSGNGSGSGGEGEFKDSIVIKPVDVEKEYTGEEIFAEQRVIDGDNGRVKLADLLTAGYSYTVVVDGSRIDVGFAESKITEFKLFDSSGKDVTDNYNIVCEKGLIRVTKTMIHICMPSSQKVYDGTPLKFEELFEGEYGYYWLDLPNGVGDVIIDMTLYDGITEVGSVGGAELAIVFESLGAFTVLSPDGADVTDNFTVVFDSGGLTVVPRAIRIIGGSSQKVYDGTPLTCDEFSITMGTLCEGHTITVTTAGSVTDIGATDNKIANWIILDADGTDVTDFYDVTVVSGRLTVVG